MEKEMKNYDPYKRTILFFASLVNIILMTAIFAYAWYGYYASTMYQLTFYRKGHYALLALYALLMFFFSTMYGGLKIGQLRRIEVMLSQYLSLLFTNIVAYMVICLLAFGFVNPGQLCLVFLVEMIVSTIWNVIIGDISAIKRNDILKYCYAHKIRAYVIPKVSDIILMGADRIHVFDTPFLLSKGYTLSFDQRFAKRTLDLVIAVPLTVLLSPVMLLTALAIKLYDRGPVFYRQVRCTKNNREFEIIKFRSMIVNAESDGVAKLASENDSRITPVGHFIRATRIDELPQLFNIIRGDMSFVGPRPERPEIIKEYCENMPEFAFRTRVKAGLTGFAQVYGKYNTTPYDKLKLDLFYIENYSFWMDLKLILMTVKTVLKKDATEGVAEGQVTAQKDVADQDPESVEEIVKEIVKK